MSFIIRLFRKTYITFFICRKICAFYGFGVCIYYMACFKCVGISNAAKFARPFFKIMSVKLKVTYMVNYCE